MFSLLDAHGFSPSCSFPGPPGLIRCALRLLVLTRLIVRVLRCGGADWCGLVLGRVESWVRALGFPPFSLSPDPPDLLELLITRERPQPHEKVLFAPSLVKNRELHEEPS